MTSRSRGSAAFLIFLMAAAVAAKKPALPPCPPGWDAAKWADATHQTPKYAIGRILAVFPHTPKGLKLALPIIRNGFPGSKILPGKGDKVHIPCVGIIDMIKAAGNGGEGWQWLVVKDECGTCKKNVCEKGRSEANERPSRSSRRAPAGGGYGGGYGAACTPPNLKPLLDSVAARPGMREALHRTCRNNTDWTFLNAVIDEFRRTDKRWGYFCRRGHCNDPSHDVFAYYCGPGLPYDGAPGAPGVDYIIDSCYNEPGESNPRLTWNVIESNAPGVPSWTSRGRFRVAPHPSQRSLPVQKR